MTSLRLLLIPMFVALLLLAPGCRRPLALEQTPIGSAVYPTERDEQITLTVAGPIEIDVESFGGDVFITADPLQPQATVRLTRQAVHGALRADEARGTLGQISMDASIVPGEIGQRLRVRTGTQHDEPHFHRAHVHITAPEIDGVWVRTERGRVWARGIEGEVDIATTNGEVRVMTPRPMTRPVTIVNRNGNIHYRVRGESTGLFDAESVGGRVIHNIRYGRYTIDRGSKHDRLFARLNDGQNPITLRAVDGDVRIAVVSNPDRVTRIIE